MTQVNEQLERLINRKLDGELTADELLELDRELLRNPEAREMLERYAAIDAVAADVIRDCTGRPRTPKLVVPAPANSPAPVSHASRWMFVASALAACLALIIFLKTPEASTQSPTNQIATNSSHGGGTGGSKVTPIPTVGQNTPPQMVQPGEGGIWPVSTQTPRELDRVTERNVMLMTDEAGNFYIFNVDRIREVEQERGNEGLDFVNNPI